MKRTAIVNSIRRAIHRQPIPVEAILYGSEARGDAKASSDIDLLILVDKEQVTFDDEMAIIDPLYKIELKSGVIISSYIVPKRQWGTMVTPFYENVMREGIAL